MINFNHLELDSSCKLNDSKNVTKLSPHVECHAGFKCMWEAQTSNGAFPKSNYMVTSSVIRVQ